MCQAILLIFNKTVYTIVIYFLELAPPKIATFSFGDEPLNFGESASAQCTISGGDLPMEVVWMLNGMEIPSYLEVSTSKIGKRINVLSIESVKADHSGNYSCVVSNQAGTTEFTAPLIVIGLFYSFAFCKSYIAFENFGRLIGANK